MCQGKFIAQPCVDSNEHCVTSLTHRKVLKAQYIFMASVTVCDSQNLPQ